MKGKTKLNKFKMKLKYGMLVIKKEGRKEGRKDGRMDKIYVYKIVVLLVIILLSY